MKKVLFAAACLLCLAACGTKEPNYQALAVGSPDIDITTDCAWYGLLGNVQTVRYKGSSLRFTEEGNLRRGITDSELRELLGRYLLPAADEKRVKRKKKKDGAEDAPAAVSEKEARTDGADE